MLKEEETGILLRAYCAPDISHVWFIKPYGVAI